jgi:hypothetical protein
MILNFFKMEGALELGSQKQFPADKLLPQFHNIRRISLSLTGVLTKKYSFNIGLCDQINNHN